MRDYKPSAGMLENRVILITGAGDGLGRCMAKTFAEYGATIILLGHTTSKLETVYDEIEKAGHPQPAIYPMDLEGATTKDYEDLAATIKKEFGRLDGLIHNAAQAGAITPVQSYDAETWYKLMQVNLNAPFLLTQACLELLKASSDATVIFVGDKKTRAYWGAYGVSKAALEGFMKILADELEENTSVRVNCLDPGPLRTKLRANIYPGEKPEDIPTPETVMPGFLYLAGPDSKGITGKTFTVEDF